MFENALGYTLIKADRVIDGEGGYPIKKGAVLILDGDVIALGNQDSIVPDGKDCLLYTSPSPRDATLSRMPSSA